MHEQEIEIIIAAYAPGKLKYVEKQANREGFDSAEEFLLSQTTKPE